MCFTLFTLYNFKKYVLFVNAWSDVSVQFGDILRWNTDNSKAKTASIF